MSAREEELAAAVAELGALPMPVGPGPQSRSILDRALDALGARMTKDDLRLVLENVIDYAAGLEAEREQLRQLPSLPLDKLAKALLLMETGPALAWAHAMSDHDLHGFLDDLVSAAMGRWQSDPEVPDRTVLANVERVCATWRTPGLGNRLDGSEFDGAKVRIAPSQVPCEVPDGEHAAWVRHSYRTPHDLDLPETGGA